MLIEENSAYRRFTRLWHVLGIFTALGLGYTLSQTDAKQSAKGLFGECFYCTLTFLLSWGINIGMTIWVSFVAGLVMYKNLERHTFGFIQGKLFPFYFLIMTIASFLQLGIFVHTKGLYGLTNSEYLLLGSLGSAFLCGFLNGLYLNPILRKTLDKRVAMEKEEGVMAPNIGSKLGEDPAYKALSRKFGIYHGYSTMINLLGLAGDFYVLYYMSLEIFHGAVALNKV